MKVLVVDDVSFVRRILERLIDRHGFTTVTADCGTAGLERLRKDPTICAVVTDLHMPDMSGFDFFLEAKKLERIADDGVTPPPPFILLTAEQDERILEMALDCGFVQVMHKPPDEEKLISQLKAIQAGGPQIAPTRVDVQEPAPAPAPAHPAINNVPTSEELAEAMRTLDNTANALLTLRDVNRLLRLHGTLLPHLQRIEEALSACGHEVRPQDESFVHISG